MKLPFWRTKSAAPVRIPTWATPFESGAAPRSYEAQVREAYLGNPVASRAVRLVAEGAGGAPLVSNPAGHPALGLLASAGYGASGPGLLETLATQLLLHGNAYVEAATGPDGLPAALFALRPERVTVEADGQGWPTGYLYRAGDSVTRYPAETVGDRAALLHIRGFHPLDDHYGLGCLGAAAGAVSVHNAAARWNRALLDNAARPSGALVYQPGDGSTLSAEQFARLKAEMEAGFARAANAGRPMLLEGGLSWQAMSLTPAEMDFARARDTAAREIALAFGVPPLLLGLAGDATYSNYKEANRELFAGVSGRAGRLAVPGGDARAVATLGLDCVGVVLVAAAAAGLAPVVPAYALGGDHEARVEAMLVEAGCVAVAVPLPGDVLVLAPSARQRHLCVVTPAGVVHAHAGLARVVEGPIDAGWHIVGAWRLPGAR